MPNAESSSQASPFSRTHSWLLEPLSGQLSSHPKLLLPSAKHCPRTAHEKRLWTVLLLSSLDLLPFLLWSHLASPAWMAAWPPGSPHLQRQLSAIFFM